MTKKRSNPLENKLSCSSNEILVFVRKTASATPSERGSSALTDTIQRASTEVIKVNLERLQTELGKLIQGFGTALMSVPNALGEYQLDEVQVTVEVTAEGTVGLLGSGGTVAGQGGVSLLFKKRSL